MQSDSVIIQDDSREIRKLSEINHARTITKLSLIVTALTRFGEMLSLSFKAKPDIVHT